MWKIALTAVVVICALFLIVLAMIMWRLRAIGSRVGSFQCALFDGGRWRAGVATYSQHHLNWHRAVSLAVAPTRRFDRRELYIICREDSHGVGISTIVEAQCRYHDSEVRIAADDSALDGLVSWLEASPPQTLR